MSIQGLERLVVWKRAKEFVIMIYKEILPLLPQEEKWAMNHQLRRSAQSIPANIAEGYGRYYYQETIHFCYIARGSLEETLSHLSLAYELEYIPKSLFERIEQASEDITRLLNGYIAYLKKSKRGENEPGASLSINEPSEVYDLNIANENESN